MPTSKSSSSSSKSKSSSPSSSSSSRPRSSSSSSQSSMNFEIASDNHVKSKSMLDDTAIISDVLVMQKGLVKRYGNALCEGSCDKFRNLVNKNLTEVASDQFESFLYMKQKNLYPVEAAPAPKLTEAKDKFKGKEQKMKK